MKRLLYVLTLIISISASSLYAQTVFYGSITDKDNGEDLIGVNVFVDSLMQAVTDYNGDYKLQLNPGSYELSFSYLTHQSISRQITINNEDSIELNISMSEASETLDIVVVSGSRYEKKLTEETVTIEVITPELIQNNTNETMADMVERVPGVQILDGQVNIRSGSGYAYGAGSRVMVLVDDQPILAAEISDVKWNFMPVENAEQIEVIKGASSVLYGSSALNGVIHLRTAHATEEPFTQLEYYAGVVDGPRTDSLKWWRDTFRLVHQPLQVGTYFAHRQRIQKNFDLSIGGNVHYQNGHNKDQDERRYRFSFNTRYRHPTNKRITYGLNGNLMYYEIGNFFIWGGVGHNFEHISQPLGRDRYTSYTLDPYVTIFDKKDNRHSIKARYFNITKRRGSAGDTPAIISNLEYQYHHTFKNNFVLSSGTSFQHFKVRSVIFTDDPAFNEGGIHKGNQAALFSQVEKRFKDRLSLVLGARWENFLIDGDLKAALPVFRTGFNYEVNSSNFLRGSFGQGYRLPSLAERYIDDEIADGLYVIPNPELTAESGWSSELAYKKTLVTDHWKGYFDASFFWMEYSNMIEFNFGIHVPDSLIGTPYNIREWIGFKSLNISKTRIAGWEFSFFGQGEIAKRPTRIWAGYTYSYPGDLSPPAPREGEGGDSTQYNIGTYLGNLFSAIVINEKDSLLFENNSILKYRSLHTARADIEVDIKKFTLGGIFSLNGYIYRVDPIFNQTSIGGYELGIKEFRDEHMASDAVFDLKTAYAFNDKNRLIFNINNIFNREYSSRPGKMSAPRSYYMKYIRRF